MAYDKIILKKENSNDKLYPRTLASELIKDDETTFTPQEQLTAGRGINIDSSSNITTNLTINNTLPTLVSGSNTYNWSLDSTNRTVDSTPTIGHTTQLVSSDGIAKYSLRRLSYFIRKEYDSPSASTFPTTVANDVLTAYNTFKSSLPPGNSGINIKIFLVTYTGNEIEIIPTMGKPTLDSTHTRLLLDTTPTFFVIYNKNGTITSERETKSLTQFITDYGINGSDILLEFLDIGIHVYGDGYVS